MENQSCRRPITRLVIPSRSATDRPPRIWPHWIRWGSLMRVGRKRKYNKHLPNSVYHRHNAYYFVDHTGKWHRLGTSLGEAYRSLANFVDSGETHTVNDLCTRYTREVLSSYSTKEQKNRAAHLARIQAVFGQMRPTEVTPVHVRAFRDKVGRRQGREWRKPQLAFKALATLSHVFTWAAEWGVIERNPCFGVQRPPQARRTRYPTDDEFTAVYERCTPMHQIAMDLALLTGLRREDILQLDRDSVTDEGLLVNTRKTGKSLLFSWSENLRSVVNRGWAIQPKVRRHLVCNRAGKKYTPDGFSTIWRRARGKAMESGKLREPYRFNDIRAKSASDDDNIDRASHRLGHTSRQTTERYYIRKPKKVDPLK